jgi:hypothetical protein
MEDHDQRFKGLLHDFLGEFMHLFFPEWAARLDFTRAEFIEQEVQFDPVEGGRRLLDLVAQVATREAAPEPRTGADCWLLLIHVEVESADSVAPFRPRMCEYYGALRRKHPLPVLPIALYLRVGLEGVGWDVYEERLWDRPLLRFEYPYVGLPALDGLTYLHGLNLLGVALSALMRLPADRRAGLKFEANQRIARSGETSDRKYKLSECWDAYVPLNEVESAEYERLRQSDQGREVREMTIGWIERGRIQGHQEVLQMQLEKRFGPLSTALLEKLKSLPPERLDEIALALLDAKSLTELGLDDG